MERRFGGSRGELDEARPAAGRLPAGLAPGERLRAALRLVFDGPAADRLAAAADADPDPAVALRPVVQAAAWRARLARWTGRVLPRDRCRVRVPLVAAGAPSRAALALALHLGLDLDATTLADLFDETPEEVGRDLLRARETLAPAIARRCRRYDALLGRDHDPSLEPAERVAFLQHSGECLACRRALVAVRALDDDLVARVDRLQASLPVLAPGARARGRLTRLALGGGVALAALLLLLGALAAGDRLLSRRPAPVPLLPPAAEPPLSGWLVVQERGGLQAIDLSTGRRQPLLEQVTSDPALAQPYLQIALSPSGNLVALWTVTQEAPFQLRVARLDGTRLLETERAPRGINRWITGWLDDHTLLIVESPQMQPDESEHAYEARASRDTRLIQLDIRDGRERSLSAGVPGYPVPSPDGRLIALLRDDRDGYPGATLEIRPLTVAGLGPPIATDAHRSIGSLAWAPDGSRVYFVRISDEQLRPIPPDRQFGPGSYPIDRADLAALDLQGHVTPLTHVGTGQSVELLSLSPDGRQVIYRRTSRQEGSGAVRPPALGDGVWSAGPDGSGARKIADASWGDYWLEQVVWSPDGRTLLLAGVHPFYLPAEEPVMQGYGTATPSVPWQSWVAYGQDGRGRLVRAGLGDGRPLRWLPPEAIAAQPAGARLLAGQVSAVAPAEGTRPELRLDAGASASPDGEAAVLSDAQLETATIWDVPLATGRRLSSMERDLTWFPDGGALLGVADLTAVRGVPSRLEVFGREPFGPIAQFDFTPFDPAGVGDDSGRRYAHPLVSPDGGAVAFFLVDDRQGSVALWLASWRMPARPVAQWPLPPGKRLDPPLAAVWADARTLAFGAPEDWLDGLPRAVLLRRAVLGPDGGVAVDDLLRLEAGGGERGITLGDLALSPDGSHLAYRLRHFTRLDVSRGRFDTLEVAPVGDLTRRLEVARGDPGDGLGWGPDGRWLAAGLRGRVVLLSADGRRLIEISPPGKTAAFPIWVRRDDVWEIWFSLDDGQGSRLMSVRVR